MEKKKSGNEKETPSMSFLVESQGTGEIVELLLNVEEVENWRSWFPFLSTA